MHYITYLLGAGASASALPVVSNMNGRIDIFLNIFLKHQLQHGKGWPNQGFEQLANDFQRIHDESKQHSTIDTYAKKLYLKEKKHDLLILKSLISSYLVYEQTRTEEIKDNSGGVVLRSKSKTLDQRYDAFLATVLNKNGGHLAINDNIAIVTWNYDYQLELAYYGFAESDFEVSRDRLRIYPREKNISFIENRIIKLNGTADIFRVVNPKTKKVEFGSTNHYIEGVEYSAIFHALQLSVNLCYNHLPDCDSSIKFAWEQELKNEGDNPVKMAKFLLNSSKVLIVIGYSFPVFNREIDRELLGDANFNKIFLQCNSSDANGIKSRISNIIKKEIHIEIIEDLEQFYIPFEI